MAAAVDVTEIAARLERWVATEPALPGPLDPATAAFCRRKLRELARPGVLAQKLELELGDRRREPLGRVLIVIAEHDVLGTIAGVIAAHVTGNRIRIKAHATRSLVAGLAAALGLADCEILAWDSRDQDDRAVLDGIDGVLLAGGEALIRHYRRVAPPGVRLIEFGPKLSCAAIGRDAGDLDRVAAALVTDATLFGQGVCSSPQLILVEDDALARELCDRLREWLADCPVLPSADRLIQMARVQELRLLARLGEPIAVEVDPISGWGMTRTRTLDVGRRLPRSFTVVVGPLDGQLAALARAYPHELQTLGTAGHVPPHAGFTHRCPIGRMHERSPLEPHDGVLELASLVRFVSREEPA